MDRINVGENEPHALVDRRLTPGERCKVEPHLATHPTVAERVRDLLVQRAVLAALGEASGTAGPRPGASSVAPRASRSGGAGIFGGPSPPHAHLPKRRARCWKERRARRKSISRNAGQFTSVK